MTKRRWAKVGAFLIAVIVALAVAGLIVVRSAAFHRYMLATIIGKTQAATGARVEIGDFSFSWSGLRIDFDRVVLHGTEASTQRPLVATDHLGVAVKILSLWKQQIDLKEILLEHPVVSLQVDQSGHNNLPVPPSTPAPASGNSTDAVFDLAIKHVSVSSGELYYNDRSIPVSADLHNFQAESSFSNLPQQQYKVAAGYEQGVVSYQNLKPVSHGLHLKATATRSGVTIDELVATAGKSRISVAGALQNYANPSLDGTYEASLDTAEVAAVAVAAAADAKGQVQLRGKINYQPKDKVPFITGLSVDGSLDSNSLTYRTPTAHGMLTAVRAKYQLSNANFYVSEAQAATLGGRISAKFEMKHLDATPAARLDATGQNILLRQVAEALAATGSTPQIAMAAKADVKAQVAWTGNIRQAAGTASAIISTPAATSSANGGMPLDGKINAAFRGGDSVLTVSDSYLHSASTRVNAAGTLSDRSNLHVELTASDLHEIGNLIQSMQPVNSPNTSAVNTKSLGGSAHFRGDVTGRLADPKVAGQLSATNLDYNGSHWRTLQTNVELSSTGVSLQNLVLRGQQQGQLSGNARVTLTNWSYKNSNPVQVQLAAEKLPVADLQQLAGQHYPVTGTLSASVQVNGSQAHPIGHGSLSLAQATAWDEPIEKFSAEFNGDEQTIHSKFNVQIAAGTVTGAISFAPKSNQYDASVSSGGIKLEQVNALQARTPGLAGTLTLDAKGHGTIQNPSLNANLSVANLKVRDQAVSELSAQLNIADQRANGTVHARVQQSVVDAKGDVQLTGERLANLRVDTGTIPIALLLTSYAPKQASDVNGDVEFHATLNGPLNNPAHMQAQLEIPKLNVGYKAQQLSNPRPMRISYANNIVRVEDAELKGAGTDVKLTGSVPTTSGAAMDVKLNGNLDLAILKGFQQGLESSGSVNVDLAATGNFSNPQVRGQAKIVNAAVSSGDIPLGFENVNGDFTLDGNRVEISKFSGNVGGGDVNVTGFALYGQQSNFSVNLNAQNVRVRYPDGVRAIVAGNLAMSGSPADSTLSGRMSIERLSFTKDFDLANFMAQFSGETPVEAPSDFARNMKLQIAVLTANNLNAVSSKLSIEGTANLTVGGTAADPVILGRTSLTAGDIFFLGKRYQVQSGTIEFANPVRTQPTLNVYVTTTVQQYNITLNFVGPIDRLRTNYTSDPSLAPSDIINLIAFGKTAEESASASSTPTSVGAESVLAQGVSGQVSGRLEKLAGISQLSIDPLAGTNPNDPGSQISVQQRVSGNLLLTFSTDVTSTQNQAVQLEYQARRNVSISVLRDQNGGYAIDVRVRKEF
jgi:translocation and assembly module TamB